MRRSEKRRVALGLSLLLVFLTVGVLSILFVSQPVPEVENLSQPKLTTIGELLKNPKKFDNRTVKVRGKLIYAGIKGLPFYLEDENGELPCFPDFSWDLFLPHEGKMLVVVGVFEYRSYDPMAPLRIVVKKFSVVSENE